MKSTSSIRVITSSIRVITSSIRLIRSKLVFQNTEAAAEKNIFFREPVQD